MQKKALIAMSGGVDSSVAAYLAKRQGFDCSGITMKLFAGEGIADNNVQDARGVADAMGIPFYVNDFTDDFKKQVIDRFIAAYENGATPNPCVDCNRYIKFAKLISMAQQLDMDYLVTGHYARIAYNDETGRYLLKKAADSAKDQSYFLYTMTQRQMARVLFPLGSLCKSQVRNIAKEQGFGNADKQESQDICFVPDGRYADFIERYTGRICESGNFTDMRGNILGRHKGIIRYTIGQRRGLGLPLNKPVYVHSKNRNGNTVTVCEDGGLFGKTLDAADFNWISCENITGPIRVKVKIRHNQKEQRATAVQTSPDTVHVEFDEPQRAIARGQAAVLYDGDIVVGGGTII